MNLIESNLRMHRINIMRRRHVEWWNQQRKIDLGVCPRCGNAGTSLADVFRSLEVAADPLPPPPDKSHLN